MADFFCCFALSSPLPIPSSLNVGSLGLLAVIPDSTYEEKFIKGNKHCCFGGLLSCVHFKKE